MGHILPGMKQVHEKGLSKSVEHCRHVWVGVGHSHSLPGMNTAVGGLPGAPLPL